MNKKIIIAGFIATAIIAVGEVYYLPMALAIINGAFGAYCVILALTVFKEIQEEADIKEVELENIALQKQVYYLEEEVMELTDRLIELAQVHSEIKEEHPVG